MIDQIDAIVAILLSVFGGFALMVIPDMMHKIQFVVISTAMVTTLSYLRWRALRDIKKRMELTCIEEEEEESALICLEWKLKKSRRFFKTGSRSS